MPTIRLGDPDRERWNCPEWLDVPDTLPIREATALEDAGGAYMDFFKRHTARGFATVVWVALNRAGIALKLADLDELDLNAIQVRDSEPGKAPSGDGSSPTPQTSASSTTSRRRTSKKST